MQNAIKKAIENGYEEQDGYKSVSCKIHKDSTYTISYSDKSTCHCCYSILSNQNKMLLDPLFWQALGKQQGWDGKKKYCILSGEETDSRYCSSCYDCPAHKYNFPEYYWHNFIDHIAVGGSIDDFFNQIIR